MRQVSLLPVARGRIIRIEDNNHPNSLKFADVLMIASVLGLAGVDLSFLLLFIPQKMGFSQGLIQAVLFLRFDVARHSTIYEVHTAERHYWEHSFPSLKLFVTDLRTRIAGTLVACYGPLIETVG